MAEEALSYAGLYLDELNKIRLLEPESAQQTNELKDECKDFVDSKFSNRFSLSKEF
jgi:intraflagellar transport protein 20